MDMWEKETPTHCALHKIQLINQVLVFTSLVCAAPFNIADAKGEKVIKLQLEHSGHHAQDREKPASGAGPG